MIDKILIADESVTDKIYVFRNQRVMLDSDIAELYDVETRSYSCENRVSILFLDFLNKYGYRLNFF